jgi:hypothetical protein
LTHQGEFFVPVAKATEYEYGYDMTLLRGVFGKANRGLTGNAKLLVPEVTLLNKNRSKHSNRT